LTARLSSGTLHFVQMRSGVFALLEIRYSSWAHSMSFRIESPSLKIGGVYDSYNFSTDESGKIATGSAIWKSAD
jgi:hypothetical protein